MQQNERTYRQINPHACLDDGMERARRRCSCTRCKANRYEARGSLALIAFCVVWALFYGWLVNR